MKGMLSRPADALVPQFWRDPTLPFVEARSVEDGRHFCYAKHTHETFSIGAVTGGRSLYLNGRAREQVGAGAVVVVNPEEVHACNPCDNQSWSYRMLYVDVAWLTALQHELGFSPNQGLRAYSTTLTTDPILYAGLNRFYTLLLDRHAEQLHKHSAAISFFSMMHSSLTPTPAATSDANSKLIRAAEFISDNCTQSLKLDDICVAADLSASYLIRAFKQHFGMTPHAYLVNRRIQYGRARLRQGHAIADVALEAGFSDQAHFQREFKRLSAATPGQYRA